MSEKFDGQESKRIVIDRRSALKYMAGASAGLVCVLVGGLPRIFSADDPNAGKAMAAASSTFSFAQLSDSHIGFNKEANPEPAKTLQIAIDRLNDMKPAFVLHTGDITHLSKPEQFDAASELLNGLKMPVHYIPGEHDILDEGGGQLYLQRYGKGTMGNGWYSFDDHGVHFVALVNVFNFAAGQETKLGTDQLKWMKEDLRGVSSSSPVVVFTHIPLWPVYSPWGWGTADGSEAVALLKRFGSVTILNGHIHQVIQKAEGNITFHTARGTAYPQPEPGKADTPGPLMVPADQLRSYLGYTSVITVPGQQQPALTDSTLI